ncbi:MAG: hypothetical protein CW691_00085 [Candidatus Bathyarchaeum sp.]|nr:MAG: hypothetical protein CW691_00085 [Candidatus Bathyarchaeum sp.]
MLSGIIEAVFGLVIALVFVVIGGIIIWALYPINPFMAVVGVVLLIIVAVALVLGFVKSNM